MLPKQYAPAVCLDDIECEFAQMIVSVHDTLVSKRGYSPDLNEEQVRGIVGEVASVVSAAFCTHFHVMPKDRYKDVFHQVADFATHLSKDHIFPDGNKRTTVVVSLALLEFAGCAVSIEDANDPEDNEVYKWIQDIVTGERDIDSLAEFLRGKAC